MIGVPEARFHVAAVRQLAAAGLTEYTDKELICRVISEEARKMDIRVIESDIFGDIPCTHPFYQSLGAADLLRERHGQEYVLNIVGLRKPKTLMEYARHFVTGKYPKS